MRTGTLRRNVQHLSRAFTASRFSSVSYEANLRSVTFLAWSKVVEQLWKSSTILGQGIGQGTCSPAGDIRVSFKRGRARYFCIVSGRVFEGQSTVPTSNSAYAGAISRRLCSLSNNQYSKLCFELIPGSTQVSNPSSGGSVRWDISEMMIPSTLPSQGKSADRNSVPPEREGEVDVGEERIRVTKVRKKKDDNKMRIDDGGIEWGQQHARVRENETRQREEISCSKERFMVAFQYGSIVFFNFGDDEEVETLTAVRKFCTDEFRETRKDDYGVLVRPTLPEWSEGGQDRITLRMIDTDNIRVISSILGQSIALDHYAKKVDEMVNTFSELNQGMEKSGTFTMTRKSLFQLVAAANTTLADVILRLGLLERSDAAWKDANYAQIWEYLRDDFELDERFESLDFKLNVIQHNLRFFLEILQNKKSDTL